MARWSNMEMDVAMHAAHFSQAESSHWSALRDCVDQVRAILRKVNEDFAKIEDNRDLASEGIARQRAALARQVLSDLDNFKPLTKAENTSARRIESMEKQSTALPPAPEKAIDAWLAAEIRSHVAKQERPELWVLKHAADARVVGAIIHAPPFLSGMSDENVAFAKAEVGRTMHPELSDEKKKIEWALDVCQKAVEKARQMIEARAGMRKDSDGAWRHSSQQAPRISFGN